MANKEAAGVWKDYTDTIKDWRELIVDIEPKLGGCGKVYEIPNPINRPNESFAIADMSELDVAEPHYHPDGVTEIYIILEGLGLTVIGNEERAVNVGDVVVTPPNTAHFTIPNGNLVLAVINTPPFQEGDYISLTDTNQAVLFDREQFERLASAA